MSSFRRALMASVTLLVVLRSSGSATAQTLRDDFDGNALNPDKWVVDSASPSDVTVANGFMTLANSSSSFPVVTSKNNPFPDGDFRVRIGFRYVAQGFCGDGFGAIDNFWENYHGENVCRPFMLWQDSGGLYSYTGSVGGTVLLAAPETSYHEVECTYVSGEYRLYLDGAFRASGACAPKATGLFFGHPHPISCGGPWSSLSVDYVEVSPIGATASGQHSWGKLKQLYR